MFDWITLNCRDYATFMCLNLVRGVFIIICLNRVSGVILMAPRVPRKFEVIFPRALIGPPPTVVNIFMLNQMCFVIRDGQLYFYSCGNSSGYTAGNVRTITKQIDKTV